MIKLEFDPALDTIPVFTIDLYSGEKTCELGEARMEVITVTTASGNQQRS